MTAERMDPLPDCPRCGRSMVVRRARSGSRAGPRFLGCSEFPRCRATSDLPITAISSPPVGPGSVVGTPGGSARLVYERRHRSWVEARPGRILTAAASAPLAAVFVFAVVSRSSPSLGFVAAVGTALVIALGAFVAPHSITAWRTGSVGEERTAVWLAPLRREGFVVIHDRKIPASRANIDHVVIGPPGVFVIETKNIAGRLEIDDDDIRIAGRRVAAVDEVLREAQATYRALATYLQPRGLGVVAVVCVHRADLPWFRREVRKVRIVTGRGLVGLLRQSRAILSDEDITALAALATQNLHE